MRKEVGLSALGMLAAAVACGQPEDRGTLSMTRVDSAGIEVVTTGGNLSRLPRWTVGPPDLVIADSALYRVTDLDPVPRGGVVVASWGSHEILVFGADGGLERTLGREGQGPGEFDVISSVVALSADSLVVLDSRQGRLTFFGRDGRIGRNVDVSALVPRSGFARLHGVADGFVLVGVESLGALAGPGRARGAAYSFRLDAQGDSIGELGPFPGTEVVRTDVLIGALAFGATLFSGTRRDRLIIAPTDRPEVLEVDPDHGLVRIARWPDHERAVSDARMAEYVENSATRVPEEQREVWRQAFGDMPHAEREPAYYDLVVSSSGETWVGDYPGPEALQPDLPGPPRDWLVLGADGAPKRRVSTPAGFRLMAVEDPKAYGVQMDAFGTETVVVLPVVAQ